MLQCYFGPILGSVLSPKKSPLFDKNLESNIGKLLVKLGVITWTSKVSIILLINRTFSFHCGKYKSKLKFFTVSKVSPNFYATTQFSLLHGNCYHPLRVKTNRCICRKYEITVEQIVHICARALTQECTSSGSIAACNFHVYFRRSCLTELLTYIFIQ